MSAELATGEYRNVVGQSNNGRGCFDQVICAMREEFTQSLRRASNRSRESMPGGDWKPFWGRKPNLV
ncbi:hypothetical protein PM082_017402 [Marasmius tenuissimus]|nr:hypothetical protein PM082_017402 [Marasmius tenuissimus]